MATLGLLAATGIGFAGSAGRIADGIRLAGADIGGLTASQAEAKLARRAAALASVPVVFTVGERRFAVTPERLDVRVDWGAAVADAVAAGDGPAPLRGLKRLKIRLLGADLEPVAEYYEPGLRYQLETIARRIEAPAHEAAVDLRGLAPVVVPARVGGRLDVDAARAAIVAALAGFDRRPVALPVAKSQPDVTAADLVAAVEQVRVALSAPVRLHYRGARLVVAPAELARLLDLPSGGATHVGIGGRAANRYFRNLGRGVGTRARSADFVPLANGRVRVVPGRAGRELDVRASASALLAAALSTTDRQADLVVRTVQPKLTTAEANALGITDVLASYSTPYSGSYDRIRNLQLAVEALDGTLVKPGESFSFNGVVGPRTEERGYRPAPVIMNGEYEDGVGGGVSQVATTVFNAAWEAGLRITARTAHALYISRYPLGRDATVDYPSIDLRFVNDTRRPLFIRARNDDAGISVALLGGETNRRVVSDPGALRAVAPPQEERIPDPSLSAGERVVEDDGEPARAVAVVRTIYVGDDVLRRETWTTSYRSEPMIVRVGTKPKPKEKKKPAPTATTTKPATTTAATTTTRSGGG